MAAEIPRPKAILCISAHWFDACHAVSATKTPETIHDFYGFPPEPYDVYYPASGAAELAEQVAGLSGGGIALDTERGLDHGAWSVLHFMYPAADIPVCQLSVNSTNSPPESYNAGTRLAALRMKVY